MRNVLVGGGAGLVGSDIVRALLGSQPALHVIVTSRSAHRLDRLERRLTQARHGRLTTIVGNVGEAGEAAAIAARLGASVGPLDIAIPALGGWWDAGPLLGVEEATWRGVMDEMLTAHFHFARTFIPELARRPGSLYLGIGGGAALRPILNASIVSIAAAAQAMMTRALAAENRSDNVRIGELIIDGPVAIEDAPPSTARSFLPSDVGFVVEEIVRTGTSTWPGLGEDGPLLIMRPKCLPPL